MTSTHNDIAVIGAGPAGLMAAEVLAQGGARVTVYDAMPSAGRKFLMAGRGGLNLTHSEQLAQFMARYREAAPNLQAAIAAFSPEALRAWSEALGEPTFVGSSGRVFPNAFKASPLLRAWLRRLDASGVRFAFRHRWTGWDGEGRLLFRTPDGEAAVVADATVLALGGASWPRLGSDGGWVGHLAARGIAISRLRPANSGFTVAWSNVFRDRFEGQPLKGVALTIGAHTVRGEAMITRSGIEGGAVYALSAELREAVLELGHATLMIALRPDLDAGALTTRLSGTRGKQSLANFLRKAAQVSPVGIGLMQEAAIASGRTLASFAPAELAQLINAIPVQLTGIAPIERAISTAGGITFDELDDRFMLRKLPGVFAAGEMLDWEAPTGGYLLQASFATGAAAGRGVLRWLAQLQKS
ncbi:aminoacetone oxidase family FAD-binding enzyme [Bradyrhizobium sp. WBOS7]|uniref:Aminoacetone oxidase family FAD-binding enzyme n=1 Tax=Bradyrhizobium betae TaxID=244734 RepID=A0AAE9NE43_9BRAD|nr:MULTISPECIES: TIGR03862 family flavoprotein [Bradyrhizobium]MDD1573241.1 aminoacetone oxidase family FAD-binding enzyme [Bradyrhizobium sp. WBOS1]UUO37713.1 aminoacetone oxidase family FAD-binding enzyme [Bradyrhizobium sp. WBOS01]MDD1528277.1 aminoacetone oxidase family FAD-binding enzyme [Bradyrhizobium sp. WBOS2]MDD1580226.1 aminoacetone oxidase family FAD-binding enzyme [Bradyrhizobium sp. WBOS7]MDD1603432.1 aminoacetone oxidase family FAD-binding enzyme [Bradyrhizobium sp. WBOS16]